LTRTPSSESISTLPDDVGVKVIRILMIISRSVIRAIAAANIAYSELRAHVWQLLATMPIDNAASESARVLLGVGGSSRAGFALGVAGSSAFGRPGVPLMRRVD
jgi:hypothetical protein